MERNACFCRTLLISNYRLECRSDFFWKGRKQDRTGVGMHSRIICLFMGLIVGVAVLVSPGGASQENEAAVAVVNGVVITDQQLENVIDQRERQPGTPEQPSDETQLLKIKNAILDALINKELLFQQSKKAGVAITEEDINQRYDFYRQRHADEKAFLKWMHQMGLSETRLKRDIEQVLAINTYISKDIVPHVEVTEKEMQEYYDDHKESFRQPEMVRASHILIKLDPGADEERKEAAKEELLRIRKRIIKGENFGELAKKFSQGPSASRGGDLGYFARGKMVKEFEDAAFSMKPGQVSGIVETSYGFHLIQTMDHRASTIDTLEEVHARLQQFLNQGKIKKAIDQKVEELKQQSKIERFLPRNGGAENTRTVEGSGETKS